MNRISDSINYTHYLITLFFVLDSCTLQVVGNFRKYEPGVLKTPHSGTQFQLLLIAPKHTHKTIRPIKTKH